MSKVVRIENKNSIQNAAEVLKSGGILIFPTDTVYGIGCLLNYESIVKLYKIKKRPLTQPTAILISKNYYPKININDQNIEQGFLTGKVTLLIKKELVNVDLLDILIKDGKVGIRIPKYSWLEKLINQVGPIVASSANFSGRPTPKNFSEVSLDLINQVDLTIKTSENLGDYSSAVYDIGTGKYLRK